MDEVNAVRIFFAQRHITLNDEWEENVIRYIKLNIHKADEDIESYNLAEVVFEQWLYSDLRESTRSDLNIPAVANSYPVPKPAVLQLMSILDISESCYNQYRSTVMDLSNDNSEFRDPSEMPQERQKTKHGTMDMKTYLRPTTNELKKKGMYMYEFSDGNISLKAVIGGCSIYGLDHNTLLGAKVLFIPKIVCCNRVMKLNSKNCQFLGGCNEQIMEKNSPVLKILCQKLGMNHEEAFLKATKAKNQLVQTMAATNKPPPQEHEVDVVEPLPSPSHHVPDNSTIYQPPLLPKKSSETCVLQSLEPQPKKLEATANDPSPLSKNLQEGIAYISTCVIDDVTDTAAIDSVKKPANVIKQQKLNESSLSLVDSFNSFPSPPKYQPSKPVLGNSQIRISDISDTTANDNAKKSTISIASSNQKSKQAILNPTVKFKPPLKDIQIDNDGFKKPRLPVRRVQRPSSSCFVPETPAPVYNAVKPSETLADIDMGPKKLFQLLTASEKDSKKRPLLNNHLRVKVEQVVAPLKKELSSSPEDTEVENDPLTDSPDGGDVQMNGSNSIGGRSSQYHKNGNGKYLGKRISIYSEDESMETILANKSLHHKTPVREETSPFSIDQEISLVSRKRPAEKLLTPPQNPRKLNFTQPLPVERKKNLPPAELKKDKKIEISTRSAICQKYYSLNLVKLGNIMDEKKFWFKPKRRRIQPIYCETDSQLDRKKWSVVVKVSDETVSDVAMVIDKEFLTNLLQFSKDFLEKVIAEKDVDEIEKCREKARSVKEIFARSDLILEVEFTPDSSHPVIKKISSLAKALNIV